MSNLLTKTEDAIDYNSIPVYYCEHCLSLKIRSVGNVPDTEYCEECNSTNVATTTIDEWEKLYKNRYGFKFLDK